MSAKNKKRSLNDDGNMDTEKQIKKGKTGSGCENASESSKAGLQNQLRGNQ
jgi:hypothetical protein